MVNFMQKRLILAASFASEWMKEPHSLLPCCDYVTLLALATLGDVMISILCSVNQGKRGK